MKLRAVLPLLLLCLALVALCLPALAYDDAILVSAEREAAGLRSDLQRTQGVVVQDTVTEDQLAAQRGILEKLRNDALDQANRLNSWVKDVQQQLAQLGPAPDKGASETDAMATQRKTLTDAVSRFGAAQKQFSLVALEADQTSSKISAQQRDYYFAKIFKFDKSIFNLQLWSDTARGGALFAARVSGLLGVWWDQVHDGVTWAGLAVFPAVMMALWGFSHLLRVYFRRWIHAKDKGDGTPSPLRRLWRVVFGTAATGIWLTVFGLSFAGSLTIANLLNDRLDLLVQAAFGIFNATAYQGVLALLICAPASPRYRLIAVDNRAARTIPAFVFIATFIQTFSEKVTVLFDSLLLPFSLVAGLSALATVLLIGLVGLFLAILRRQSTTVPPDVPEPHYLSWFMKAVPLLWLLLAIAILALVFGYISLAYFLVGKTMRAILAVVQIVLLHHFIEALANAIANAETATGAKFRSLTSWGEKGSQRFSLLLRTFGDVLVVVIGIPIMLALLTVSWVDLRSLITTATMGYKIGNVDIAPSTIINLLVILIVGILLTRFITGWLDRRVLTQTELDKGVQSSIRTTTNYLGYFLAISFAFSVAGFDLSSIALVAGALGVGIGFGLQSIVNNLVSGLILLIERPIRVGDWTVTRAGEGIVKKINVRATEIETFDNCTIIVPNSNLITEPVRNWTHRDTLGRFSVAITVDKTSDPEIVAKLLLETAKAHPKVLRFPEPIALFNKFGLQGFEFELGGQVANVFEGGTVASELRFAITRLFREKAIEIATMPQMLDHK